MRFSGLLGDLLITNWPSTRLLCYTWVVVYNVSSARVPNSASLHLTSWAEAHIAFSQPRSPLDIQDPSGDPRDVSTATGAVHRSIVPARHLQYLSASEKQLSCYASPSSSSENTRSHACWAVIR
ncbi:uncharacterized protein SCHCODRAFT_02078750 [Schizophyllum commune H4-8]|uniref:uncharacterized protein n=1 Tax=Schizophyllum commune (strain H4-8 / FGSC 9210) TaxID=578458 RepID=UPI00215F6413|nr:uncharacterized protein SCHCODRAFT_02078750 [Schizophyllum commune H4-8]KAI5888049.1 hypothetical protein SCHCODRAFT_02078750 [Schizophyllum commune H4-8]